MPDPVLAVVFYRASNGQEPVRDWLRGLRKEDRLAIGTDIKTAQLGWPIGMPLIRKLETGLWEVRTRIDHGIARVFFTTVDQHMVLLHGIVKKSQKTPLKDLATARKRRNDVQEG